MLQTGLHSLQLLNGTAGAAAEGEEGNTGLHHPTGVLSITPTLAASERLCQGREGWTTSLRPCVSTGSFTCQGKA